MDDQTKSGITNDHFLKRTIKDTVFTDLFSDTKNVLALYRSLHPEDKNVKQSDIDIVTLEPVLTNAIYNDLGFTVGDQLVMLVEAQSTWSSNIIVRCLLYLAETYRNTLEETSQSVYSEKKVSLPKPEFYVIYTGESTVTKDIISFNDEFFHGECTGLDLKVRVIRDGHDGDILSQYVAFTRIANDIIAEMGRTQEAAEEIIRRCILTNILPEYIESKRTEVIDIMLSLFNNEEIQRSFLKSEKKNAKEEGRKEGRAEGHREGAEKKEKEFLEKMRRAGMSEEQIRAIVNVSV